MATSLYELYSATPTVEPRPLVELDEIVTTNCSSWVNASSYMKTLSDEISSCEYQLATPFGYFRNASERNAVIVRLTRAKELQPLIEKALNRLRVEQIEALKIQLESHMQRQLECLRRLEGRILMEADEEEAYEMALAMHDEEIDSLEEEIHNLDHQAYDKGCHICENNRRRDERHAAFAAAREADAAGDYDESDEYDSVGGDWGNDV